LGYKEKAKYKSDKFLRTNSSSYFAFLLSYLVDDPTPKSLDLTQKDR